MRSTLSFLGLVLFLNFHARGDALDSWTDVTPIHPAYTEYNHIIFANGKFVAGLTFQPVSVPEINPQGAISTSTDGVNWSTTTCPNGITGLAYGNGTYVASGWDYDNRGDSGSLFFSTNGTDWYLLLGTPGLNGVAFGNGMFVTVGYDFYAGNNGEGFVGISTNGSNWSYAHPVGSNYLSSVAFGNGQFIATAYSYFSDTASDVFTSTNGLTWQDTQATVYLPAGMGGATFVNDKFFIFSPGEDDYSTNPANFIYWIPYSGPSPRIWVPQYQLYVGVGATGSVYTSSQYFNWVTRSTGTSNLLYDIAYGNNRFIAVGARTDGSYTPAILASGSTIPSLTVSNQLPAGMQLTLTGGTGPTWRLQSSPDLITWSNLVTFTNIGISTQYLDSAAVNFPQRFYRTVSP